MKLVIFDNDGTLVDSETLSTQSFIDIAARGGVTLDFDDAHRHFTGRKIADSFAELEALTGKKFDEQWLLDNGENFAERLEQGLDPMPFIGQAIDDLVASGHRVCVASNADQRHVDQCLRLTGLARHFATERRFSAYDLQRWKPDPALFLHAAAQMGAAAADCVVVEDSKVGVQAALAAGMRVLCYAPHGVDPSFPADDVEYYASHAELAQRIATAQQ